MKKADRVARLPGFQRITEDTPKLICDKNTDHRFARAGRTVKVNHGVPTLFVVLHNGRNDFGLFGLRHIYRVALPPTKPDVGKRACSLVNTDPLFRLLFYHVVTFEVYGFVANLLRQGSVGTLRGNHIDRVAVAAVAIHDGDGGCIPLSKREAIALPPVRRVATPTLKTPLNTLALVPLLQVVEAHTRVVLRCQKQHGPRNVAQNVDCKEEGKHSMRGGVSIKNGWIGLQFFQASIKASKNSLVSWSSVGNRPGGNSGASDSESESGSGGRPETYVRFAVMSKEVGWLTIAFSMSCSASCC